MTKFVASVSSGYVACLMVMLIWVFWLLVSRVGATSSLTVYDLAAMRYGISAVVSLPFVFYFKAWNSLPAKRALILSIVLGPVYILTVFSGFNYAPAAHGGIFMNGLMPIFTIFLAWFLLSNAIQLRKVLGAAIIILSAGFLAFSSSSFNLTQSWLGDICFILGGLFFAIFVTLSRLWQIKTIDILFCGSVLNAVIFLPLWYLLLPTGLETAKVSMIVLQGFYQGLIPNLIGLVLIAHASRTVGADVTAAFMAAVPGFSAILGVLLLSEKMALGDWIATLGITCGLFLITLGSKNQE